MEDQEEGRQQDSSQRDNKLHQELLAQQAESALEQRDLQAQIQRLQNLLDQNLHQGQGFSVESQNSTSQPKGGHAKWTDVDNFDG